MTRQQDSEDAYQITLEDHGAYSAPYLDREKAEERAECLRESHPDIGEFYVEPRTVTESIEE